ncbi:neurogenic differentiation factor 2-like [Pollicipes pollicipes]|uniref:neurogenic differentiation factor 2-like n=1 Tax=Pollicipes pollicipes TaxID=41117 RepID=UPI001884CC92|nr:neurogenic differentiation factor 2-like [Pollicipes pollicipes]
MTAGDVNADSVTRLGEVSQEVNNNGVVKHEETTLPTAGPLKYSLRARSIKKRIEAERRQTEPRSRQPRPKARPPPLSKYRRKTANARERDRMKDINSAFEMLERSIPDLTLRSHAEKVTKITVLRLAIDYIKAMSALLDSDGACAADSPGGPASVVSLSSASSAPTDTAGELPDPLDTIEGLTDFQLPGGLDLLLDIRSDSDGLDFSCSDFSDLSCP